ncbi:hypothetical protein SHIRM173S_00890 [Streptomyces hirsutus]
MTRYLRGMSVDRGKYGSKTHSITERTGLPLSVGISGANVHDSQALIPSSRASRPSAPGGDPAGASPASSTPGRASR